MVGAVRLTRRQKELERREMFVLIATIAQDRLAALVLLPEYPSQTRVERYFHFMRDPLCVNGWLLQTVQRLEAFGYVILMAACSIVCSNVACEVREFPFPHP